MLSDRVREFVKSSRILQPAYALYAPFNARRRARRLKDFLADSLICYEPEAARIADDWLAVSSHTQLSQAGILNLETVSRYVLANGVRGAFVECGTWRGGALAFWARAFQRNGGKPQDAPIYGFDSFEGMPGVTAKDGSWASGMLHGKSIDQLPTEALQGALKGHGMNAASEETCRAIVAASGFPAQHTHIVKGWFQETLPHWKDRIGPIAVLRLDGDWYESTRTCLENLYDRVAPGGIVIIDDYAFFEGCRQAVDEFIAGQTPKIDLIEVDLCVRYFIKPR